MSQEQFKLTGEEVKKSSLQAMQDQMSVFKANLEEFAQKHKKAIRSDPVFRAQFHAMCANIGVDPLASNKVRCLLAGPCACACMRGTPYVPACQHVACMHACSSG